MANKLLWFLRGKIGEGIDKGDDETTEISSDKVVPSDGPLNDMVYPPTNENLSRDFAVSKEMVEGKSWDLLKGPK